MCVSLSVAPDRGVHTLAAAPSVYTNLLGVLFLDRLQVGSKVHGDFVLGAQQRAEDGIGRNTNTT